MGKRLLAAGLAFLMMTGMALAAEIGGVSLPDTLTVGKDTLALNGAGLRKKLFFKIYAGGLYLKAKSGDAAGIIAADAPMAIRMHFIYNGVTAKQLIEAWDEGFNHATGGKLAPIQAKIDMFNGYFTQEAKKGDIYDVSYVPGEGIRVKIKDKTFGPIPGLEFKQAVFAIWLGKIPADSGLKEGMLGK
jgi:hypothetical protein